MSIRSEYMERSGGDETNAAVALAFDLMQGDPASLKQGYTFANAVLAACECIFVETPNLTYKVASVSGELHRKLAVPRA